MQLYAHGNVSGIVTFFAISIISQFLRPKFPCGSLLHHWVDLALTVKITELTMSLAFLFLPRLPGRKHPMIQVPSGLTGIWPCLSSVLFMGAPMALIWFRPSTINEVDHTVLWTTTDETR